MLLSLAAFGLQSVAVSHAGRGRRWVHWAIGGAFLPVFAVGFVLTFYELSRAVGVAQAAPALSQAVVYAREVRGAVVIALAAATACCLLASNAAVVIGVLSLARVGRSARGRSATVAFWSGVVALVVVVVVQLAWSPMRWTSLPAGWVPTLGGLLSTMLLALALSGHHVAEDTHRASLPPARRNKAQSVEDARFGRTVAARATQLRAELIVAVSAVVASAIFAGMVTELAAFRGMLLAAGDESLSAASRARRLLLALEYLAVPLAVHAVHGAPGVVVGLAAAAASPARWGEALRVGAPRGALILGSVTLAALAMQVFLHAVPEHLSELQSQAPERQHAVVLDDFRATAVSTGARFLVRRDDVVLDGDVLPDSACETRSSCDQTASHIARAASGGPPIVAVAPDVPFRQLDCLLGSLAKTQGSILWLAKPHISTPVPPPWDRLAEPLGGVLCRLGARPGAAPTLYLRATGWELSMDPALSARRIEGSFDARIAALRALAPALPRLRLHAEQPLASELVIRAVATAGVATQATLITSDPRGE